MGQILGYSSFWGWLNCLNLCVSDPTYLTADVMASSLSMVAGIHPTVWISYVFLRHSHMAWPHNLACVQAAAINMGVQVSVWCVGLESFGVKAQEWYVWVRPRTYCCVLGDIRIDFHSGCSGLHHCISTHMLTQVAWYLCGGQRVSYIALGSLLLSGGSQDSNVGLQVWQPGPLSPESPCWSMFHIFKVDLKNKNKI